jgi:hypothetical protein
MFPFDEAVRLAESEEGTFEYRIYDKKDGGAIPA